MLGTTLDGKYQIRKLLGEGAMGSVYEAEHTATGRRVAVKVISSADLTRDPKVVSRFQREARAAGAIETQHITQVLDAGVDRESGLPFLAMEYLSGEDLMALIKRTGPLSPDLVLRLAAQACLGLMKAHQASVVHRDIKPHNLYLARREAGEVVVKLLDFGIAKVKMEQAQDTEGAELTRTGNLLGSPLYMSPEQARGQREIDHRTDLWSLGAVMYQALTGRTPYHHINALGELIIAICSQPPPPVQDFAPWVSPEAAAIVHRCLQQDPGRRCQSAEEMLGAIRPLLPYGWSIHEDMLVSLQDSIRRQAAPRLQMASVPPPAGQSGGYPAIGAAGQSGGYPAIGAAGQSGGYPAMGPASPSGSYPAIGGAYGTAVPAGTHLGAATTGALTQSHGHAAAPSSSGSKVAIALSAVTLALVVGGGIFLFNRQPQPQLQAQVAPPPPTVQPSPQPPAAPALTAAPAPAAAADTAPRRVFVFIQPADANVEVEGERATLKNGVLEITAPLGKVRKVRVFKGALETSENVSITESGALPLRIDLKPGAAKAPSTAAPGAAPGAAPAAAPANPAGIIQDTGEFGK